VLLIDQEVSEMLADTTIDVEEHPDGARGRRTDSREIPSPCSSRSFSVRWVSLKPAYRSRSSAWTGLTALTCRWTVLGAS